MTIEDKLLEIAAYTLPALITGSVAFVMMQKFYNSEESKRKFELLRENQNKRYPFVYKPMNAWFIFRTINPAPIITSCGSN